MRYVRIETGRCHKDTRCDANSTRGCQAHARTRWGGGGEAAEEEEGWLIVVRYVKSCFVVYRMIKRCVQTLPCTFLATPTIDAAAPVGWTVSRPLGVVGNRAAAAMRFSWGQRITHKVQCHASFHGPLVWCMVCFETEPNASNRVPLAADKCSKYMVAFMPTKSKMHTRCLECTTNTAMTACIC